MIKDIQAMEIQKGRNGLSSGTTVDGAQLVHCVEDGSITVAFSSGDETVSFRAGDDRSITGESISVVSGKFDINC